MWILFLFFWYTLTAWTEATYKFNRYFESYNMLCNATLSIKYILKMVLWQISNLHFLQKKHKCNMWYHVMRMLQDFFFFKKRITKLTILACPSDRKLTDQCRWSDLNLNSRYRGNIYLINFLRYIFR